MENIRKLKEMEIVVYDKDFARKNPDMELYQIYRGIEKDGELRLDITVIPPKMLGKEFVKTKGNRNDYGFQELYTVIQGSAIFLMQKIKDNGIEDVFTVNASVGNWIIVPPNYAIIAINPSKEKILKINNWVSKKTKNIYEDMEKFGGACYFYTLDGWIKNENYSSVPDLRFEQPLKNKPQNLNFLTLPLW